MIARHVRRAVGSTLFVLLVLFSSAWATADTMELLSGAKLEGKVTKIDKAAKEVTFETTLGGRPYERAYPYSRIHAVTLGDKRYILTEKPDSPHTSLAFR